MASPKLFAMNATRWLSGEMSARSPKCVRTSMFEGKCCRGSSGDLWPKGSIKQEDRITAKVRTEKSYHRRSTAAAVDYEPAQSRVQMRHLKVSFESRLFSWKVRRSSARDERPAYL